MNSEYRGHNANDDLFRIYLGLDLIRQSFGFFRGRIMENSNLEVFFLINLVKEAVKTITRTILFVTT